MKNIYTIKKHGKFLCSFVFKQGYDYRAKNEISFFAEIITGTQEELTPIAEKYDGKITLL